MKIPFHAILVGAAVLLYGNAGSARAQAIPAGVGTVSNIAFPFPQLGGRFNYALSASELISTGYYNSGAALSTNLSADATYSTLSKAYPFSAIYTGGVLLANSGQPNTFYQSLSVTQGINTKNWNLQLQDAVTYLPESPVTGLSGIPGVGDIGVDPVPVGPQTGVGILTTYGPRVSNTASVSAERVLTGRLSAQANGFDGIQRFVGDNAAQANNSDDFGGSAGVTYHFGSRSQLSGTYVFSRFTYVGTPFSFTVQGATVDYSRQWTRRISTDTYLGPQHVKPSSPVYGTTATDISGGAAISYAGRVAFYTLGYSRGVNNGSGVIAGSFSDSITAAARRQFGRQWSLSGSLGYSRNRALPGFQIYTFSGDAVTASGQLLRAFGRRFSGFASYTVEEQSFGGTANAQNAFGGTYQIVGFGINYSPGSLFLSR